MFSRIAFLVIFLLDTLIVGSCNRKGPGDGLLSNFSDEKKVNTRMEQILMAIKQKNEEALKSLFSKKALQEANDIEGGINYLFSFIEGDIKSWEIVRWSSGTDREHGKYTEMLRSWNSVKADDHKYLFFIIDFPEDTINPENTGLFTLRVIRAEDEETQFTYWPKMMIAGIYRPLAK